MLSFLPFTPNFGPKTKRQGTLIYSIQRVQGPSPFDFNAITVEKRTETDFVEDLQRGRERAPDKEGEQVHELWRWGGLHGNGGNQGIGRKW